MAHKAELQFKVFENGKRARSVLHTTIKNDFEELKEAVFQFVRKEYPELTKQDITKTDIHFDKGYAEVEAEKDQKTFKLEVNLI